MDISTESQNLKSQLETLISNVDAANKRLQDCMDEFDPNGMMYCGEWAQVAFDAEKKLMNFWKQHRNKIGFSIWLGDDDLPENVIVCWPDKVGE